MKTKSLIRQIQIVNLAIEACQRAPRSEQSVAAFRRLSDYVTGLTDAAELLGLTDSVDEANDPFTGDAQYLVGTSGSFDLSGSKFDLSSGRMEFVANPVELVA